MKMRKMMNRYVNPVVTSLLHSRWHGLLSENTLLITVAGRKSGKPYTTPVNYVQMGDELLILSDDTRTWWRNIGEGALVAVQLQGEPFIGWGQVFAGTEATPYALRLLEHTPSMQRFAEVGITEFGEPTDSVAFRQFMEGRVIVQVMLERVGMEKRPFVKPIA